MGLVVRSPQVVRKTGPVRGSVVRHDRPSDNAPSIRPTLDLRFAIEKALDARVTFTRASSGTYFNASGALATAATNAARFDHDPVTGVSKGLLIEEQRTNLLTYSEQFDNAAWTKGGTSVSANATTAPDGTVTADKLVEDTSTAAHVAVASVAVTSGTTYAYTVYAKSDGSNRRLVLFTPAAAFTTAKNDVFDLSSGTVATNDSGTASIVAVGGGWYRCACVRTATVTITAGPQLRVAKPDAVDTLAYTGDGTSGVYIWGAQLEVGSFATSYIPSTSAQTTRAADVVTMAGTNFSGWYRQEEGTLLVTADTYGIAPIIANSTVDIRDAGSNIVRQIKICRPNGYAGNSVYDASNVLIANIIPATPIAANTMVTIADSYYGSTYALSQNGATTVSTTTSPSATDAAAMMLGTSSLAGTAMQNGHIARLTYYPTRLTDAQLQALSKG